MNFLRRYAVTSQNNSLGEPMTTLDAIEVFWRPGCPFCASLEKAIKKSKIPTTKHNIWENPEAAAYVRSVADGNEVVPTVRIGDTARVNPSIKEIQEILKEKAPHLLP